MLPARARDNRRAALFAHAVGLLAVLACAVPTHSSASPIVDPSGDFLSTYLGPQNADLDVVSAQVVLNLASSTLHFDGTFAGPVGTTPQGIYVFGLDRGAGTEGFQSGTPAIGAGVFFDSLLALFPNATGFFLDLVNPGGPQPLAPGSVAIDGDTISAVVPLALVPSTGRPATQYTWNLWPEAELGVNAQVADFAPDASNALVTAVPEPTGLAFFAVGLAALFGLRSRRCMPRSDSSRC
jgi:hypothetical protein